MQHAKFRELRSVGRKARQVDIVCKCPGTNKFMVLLGILVRVAFTEKNVSSLGLSASANSHPCHALSKPWGLGRNSKGLTTTVPNHQQIGADIYIIDAFPIFQLGSIVVRGGNHSEPLWGDNCDCNAIAHWICKRLATCRARVVRVPISNLVSCPTGGKYERRSAS